jgi:hypothetical protein
MINSPVVQAQQLKTPLVNCTVGDHDGKATQPIAVRSHHQNWSPIDRWSSSAARARSKIERRGPIDFPRISEILREPNHTQHGYMLRFAMRTAR